MSSINTISADRREELDDLIGIGQLGWASVRRHKWMVTAFALLAVALAGGYLAWRLGSYTASARVLVDNRVLALNQQDAIYSVSSLNSQLMQSQVEILRSENLARQVIDQLGLLKNPDFAPPTAQSQNTAQAAPDQSGAPAGQPEESRALRRALQILQKRLSVDQVGQSYVIEIRVKASDPQVAAAITNGLVSAYIKDLAAANASVAESASGWLRNRLSNLGTSARILSAATAPLEPDGPGSLIVLAFAVFCGLSVGSATAVARDALSRKLRTREAVQRVCGAECFGALSLIEPGHSGSWWKKWKQSSSRPTQGEVARASLLDWAAERPRSLFAHGLRRTRAGLLRNASSPPAVVGITSALPREGKTVVAANLARLAALWGRKVLLIDASHYNSELTKQLAPHAELGLSDALAGAPLEPLLLGDRLTSLHFLPGLAGNAADNEAGLIGRAAEKLFTQIKSHYDIVFVDLPPLTPASDVHELAYLIDKILLVVEWERYTDAELAAILANSPAISRKLAGVVLNKVDLKMLNRHSGDTDLIGANYSDYVSNEEQIVASRRSCVDSEPSSAAQPRRPEPSGTVLREVLTDKLRSAPIHRGTTENV